MATRHPPALLRSVCHSLPPLFFVCHITLYSLQIHFSVCASHVSPKVGKHETASGCVGMTKGGNDEKTVVGEGFESGPKAQRTAVIWLQAQTATVCRIVGDCSGVQCKCTLSLVSAH